MSIRIGITGGIGSGKSVVARLMRVMDIPVYDSDIEARRLMVSDPVIRQQLQDLLGADVYVDGALNKALLADYLFASEAHACRLNGIVHPRVRDDFRRWTALHADCPCVGIESAILLEAGFRSEVDVVLLVDAPLELRIARAMARDNAPRESVERRIRNQMDDDERRSQADFVVLNDDQHPLMPQVLACIEQAMRK